MKVHRVELTFAEFSTMVDWNTLGESAEGTVIMQLADTMREALEQEMRDRAAHEAFRAKVSGDLAEPTHWQSNVKMVWTVEGA